MKKAFTLIELLIVVAIVGLVAAIGFSVQANRKTAANLSVIYDVTEKHGNSAGTYFITTKQGHTLAMDNIYACGEYYNKKEQLYGVIIVGNCYRFTLVNTNRLTHPEGYPYIIGVEPYEPEQK